MGLKTCCAALALLLEREQMGEAGWRRRLRDHGFHNFHCFSLKIDQKRDHCFHCFHCFCDTKSTKNEAIIFVVSHFRNRPKMIPLLRDHCFHCFNPLSLSLSLSLTESTRKNRCFHCFQCFFLSKSTKNDSTLFIFSLIDLICLPLSEWTRTTDRS